MQDYSFSWQKHSSLYYKKSPSSKWKFLLIGLFTAIAVFLFFIKPFSYKKPTSATDKVAGATAEEKNVKAGNSKLVTQSDWNKLVKTIEAEIAPLKGTFSIYVYDMKNDKEYGMNEDTIFTGASVNKIPIMAALYHLAAKKEIDLEKIIVLQKRDIQDYGTGSIRYDPVGTPYSIKTLARLMMEKSDNTAAYLLATNIIGMDRIQKLVTDWGLTQTDMEENQTSAKDMRILLVKMYKGDITTPALTSEMIGFMDKSDFEDRIPALLPDDVKVYHKIGDEIGKIHDAGIVELKDRPYFIGIFTTDMTDDEITKKTMAKVSKLIFDAIKS